MHESPNTVGDVFIEVQNTLYEANLRWFSTTDINNALQDSYNKLVALLCPIERAILINKLSSPYYNLYDQIPDYMYLAGVFNPTTNLWLEGLTYKQMKATYQTYLAIGEPKWVNIVDYKRVIMWPYPPGATGSLLCLYKGKAPTISADHIPVLPFSVGPALLQYFTIADLMEQAREFKKAQIWWDRALKPNPLTQTRSIFEQCRSEIQNLARADRENVLEPYRWIFHGGTYNGGTQITGETPTGTIDGTNNLFYLANVPNPNTSIVLTLNGTTLIYDTHYILNGNTLSMQTGSIPQGGDVFLASYKI